MLHPWQATKNSLSVQVNREIYVPYLHEWKCEALSIVFIGENMIDKL